MKGPYRRGLQKVIYSNEREPDEPSKSAEEAIELRMFRLITQNNVLTVNIPECGDSPRNLLCLVMVSNCSGERSFSKLKRVKNELRTTMGKNRLNMLALLSIEHKLLRDLEIQSLISDFAETKSKKMVNYLTSILLC